MAVTATNPSTVSSVATVLAAAVKTSPTPDRRWPAGPVCLAREYKAYSPDLAAYAGWVADAERRIGDTDELVQRLRLLHYGRAAGNTYFDLVLDTRLSRMSTPMTLAHAGQASLDGLLGTGTLTSFVLDSAGPWREPVDISHLWVLADAARNGLGAGGAALMPQADPYGALSWTGDLASWWTVYNDKRIEARAAAERAGQEWREPADSAGLATPLGWLTAATLDKCAVDDLLGDLDGIVLMDAITAVPDKPAASATPIADLLRDYYGPSPVQTGRTMVHSDNRFHLFVRHAKPAIPHQVDEPTGVVTLDPAQARPAIRDHVRDAAMAILRVTRLRRSAKRLALNATSGVGFVEGLLVEKSIRDDVNSPWGAAMLDEVARRFTEFLLNGLATDGWNIGTWPRKPSPLAPYGGFLLRFGDNDAARRYGGIDGAVATEQRYVRTLQEQLDRVGFTSVGTPDGAFGPGTAMALRELQIEAQQNQVWQELPAPTGGQAVALAARRFRGRVNGCLDPETAATLAEWLNPVGAVRNLCPVTVHTRTVPASGLGPVVDQDVWRFNQVQQTNVRFYAVDRLRRYPIPESRVIGEDPGMAAIGNFAPNLTTGPVLDLRTSWPEATINLRNLVPPALLPPAPVDVATTALGSTYRVIRAICHVECQGRYDIINAYDAGRVSIGVCHWALQSTGIGELAAMLAYYAAMDPAGFERDLGRLGIAPEKPWDRSTWTRGNDQAKFEGRLALYGLRDARGRVHPADLLPLGDLAKPNDPPADEYVIDYLRGWHNIHRLAMALRCYPSTRHLNWRFLLARLRMLLARPWHKGTANDPGPVVSGGGGFRVATFGDVFTSEQAVAALLRWHVNRPARVVGSTGAVNETRDAYQAVFGTDRVVLTAMTRAAADAAQVALAQEMIDRAPAAAGFQDTVRNAVTYADPEVGRLNAPAASFLMVDDQDDP